MRCGVMIFFIVLLTALPALAGENCPPGGCGGCANPATCEPSVDTVVKPQMVTPSPVPLPGSAAAARTRAINAAIAAAPDSVFLSQMELVATKADLLRWYQRHGELARGIDDARALWFYSHATEFDSSGAAAWLGRARTEEALGLTDSAAASYGCAIRIQPADSMARYELALLLGKRGEAVAAAEQLRLVTQLDAQFAPAWFNLGVALTQLEDFSGAAAAYEQTLQLRPNYAPAWFNLGAVAARVERRELAYECYQQLLLLDAELAAKLYPRIGQ